MISLDFSKHQHYNIDWRVTLLWRSVISISDGIDSFTKGSKLLIGMKAMMNNSFLDQMKETFIVGWEGKALNGYNAGGRSYGYTHVPHLQHNTIWYLCRAGFEYVTRRIDDEQAKWVRQIFEWVAEGRSYKWVATELNRLQVKSYLGVTGQLALSVAVAITSWWDIKQSTLYRDLLLESYRDKLTTQ